LDDCKKYVRPKLKFEQCLMLLRALENEELVIRVAITLVLFYALRRGEIYGLQYSDFNEEKRLL